MSVSGAQRHSVAMSISSSTVTKQGPLLDSMLDRCHQLIKKLTLLYKEAAKIDSAYDGTLSLMKGWTKTTNSSKKALIEQLLKSLELIKDTVDAKEFKDKIANYKHNEQLVITNCQHNIKALCEALEDDIAQLSNAVVEKSKKLTQLKSEMDKMEPGKQIPATLTTN